MNTRWSLRNALLPVSYRQFKSLTQVFYDAAQKEAGVPCEMKITAYSRVPCGGSLLEDFDLAQLKAEQKKEGTLAVVSAPDKLDRAIWRRAAFVEVRVEQKEDAIAPRRDFYATVSFKGHLHRQASFNFSSPVIPGDTVEATVIAAHPAMLQGEGYNTNTYVRSWHTRQDMRTAVAGLLKG